MEQNSFVKIQEKLNNYKNSHPLLFTIFNHYLEEQIVSNQIFLAKLEESIQNLENVSDLTTTQLSILYCIYNNHNYE
jgi:hypothetical protein